MSLLFSPSGTREGVMRTTAYFFFFWQRRNHLKACYLVPYMLTFVDERKNDHLLSCYSSLKKPPVFDHLRQKTLTSVMRYCYVILPVCIQHPETIVWISLLFHIHHHPCWYYSSQDILKLFFFNCCLDSICYVLPLVNLRDCLFLHLGHD